MTGSSLVLSSKSSFVLAVSLAIGFASAAPAQQKFRAPNPASAPPSVVFPAAPNIPQLNNGSLQTTPNPNSATPGQPAFLYTASMSQDARLNLNGVQVWAPRLDSSAPQLQVQNNNNNNNFNFNFNALDILGLVAGFGAVRGNAPLTYAYPPGYVPPAYQPWGGFGSNFGSYPLPVPNLTMQAGVPQSNFFNGAGAFGAFGTFGGDANPFGAFNRPVVPAGN
jgi:hypothetical protein